MNDADSHRWQLAPPDLVDEVALKARVIAAHEEILAQHLQGDPMLSPALGIQVRASRQIEGWRVLLLLTPWMLARLLLPGTRPEIAIPDDWTAAVRRTADYLILGPSVGFELLGQPQRAHLSYHEALGHYLLQPLCLDMSPYRDAEAVFAAWSQVIETRDANLERAQRDCPLQREVSRRELFTGRAAPKR